GLAIGALGLYLAGKRKESYSATSFQAGEKVLKDFPLNDVAQLRVKQGTNEVNLVRGDVWTVKERWGYPANFTELSDFLRKIWDLKPVQDVEVGPSQFGRLELSTDTAGTNSGTLIEFKDGKAANLKALVLGKKYMKEAPSGGMGMGGGFPAGRYVLVPETKKVWLVNEAFADVAADPQQWLNKDFFKVEKIKSIAVTSPNPTNSWSLSRETENGEWKMNDVKEGENFDSAKASTLNFALSSPTFNDVASPESKPEEVGMKEPTIAKIATFDGLLYTVTIGSITNEENLYLKLDVAGDLAKERVPGSDEKPEDKEKLDKEFKEKAGKLEEKLKNEQQFAKWTYIVSKYTVDPLLKPRTDFLAEKKAEANAETNAISAPIPALPPEITAPETKPSEESKDPAKPDEN
ncbi:MAG TPA: DUF4340 domain-containing protein, partial [Candidatus Kapabacteria bacterium]|nr:DUF4340 domain-containing protein [Candidatus Kapabacteria bacterium]